jgi:2-aminomuconate deaminase
MSSIDSPHAPEPVGPYPHARRVGPFLFLSGIGPRRRGSKDIPGVTLGADGRVVAYDFEVQCRNTLDNIGTVLEEAGGSFQDVIDVTVFLTNIEDDFATLNRVYAEYFPTNRPTRTTVEVSRLPTPIAVEMKMVAWLGET